MEKLGLSMGKQSIRYKRREGDTEIELLNGPIPQLKRADIVMIRHKKNFFRHFLRKFMNECYWDHTAMVLYPKTESRKRNSSVIAESISRKKFYMISAKGGIVVHRLEYYLNDSSKYDVGIKRIEGLTDEQRVRVTHFMLMNIDAPYWPWKRILITVASMIPWLRKKLRNVQRFSCSGLIQKAFYDSVNWDQKSDVIFAKDQQWTPIELQELTNPGDIARSKNTIWIYNEK